VVQSMSEMGRRLLDAGGGGGSGGKGDGESDLGNAFSDLKLVKASQLGV
jgi:hypothetical protein